MAKKTIATVIVLLLILGGLYWYQQSKKDSNDSTDVDLSVSVYNQTKNADGAAVTASPKDSLVYTLHVENNTNKDIKDYVVETSIDDISQQATLIDAQGASFDAGNNSIMWTPLDVPANGSIEKQFTVRVKDTLSEDSDLVMTVSFGNELAVSTVRTASPSTNPGPTPVPVVAKPPYKAPVSGPSAWFAFLLAISFTAGIVLYRTAKRISL